MSRRTRSRTIIYVSAAEPTAPPPTVGPAAPQRLVVPAGGTLQLDCSSAQADVVALWSRLEGQQLSQGASQLNGQLTIVDMQPADEGVYICTMTDPQDPGYREEMRAEVRVPRATRLTIKPERQTARQGGSAELQCQASDGSAGGEVRWSRAGQPLPAGAEQAGGSLLLRNIAPADRGVYVCSVDGAQSSAIVEVERLEHPVVELYPATSQQVVSGGSALIQCRVTAGQPEPQLSWTRADGSPLPRSAEQVSGGVIRFLRVTGEEDGQYVCTATNAAGSARALAILDVMSPPVIRLEQPTLYRVSEGQRVQLRCSASGDPTPSVTWEGGGVRSGLSGVPGRTILHIDDASAADAGVYTCRAENDAGRASDRLRLVVEPADDGRRPAAGGGRPPVYPTGSARPSEEVYVVPLNGSAELICLVEGSSPPVRISWVRSSGNMPDNHEVRDGTLYIFRVQKEAEGTYTCLGHGAGQQVLFRADATLRVIEPPRPPRVQVEPLRQVVQLGDAVSIQCSATGDEPISVSWERLSGPMPDSASVVQGIIAFSSIAESDAGRYICVAENTAGRAQGVAEVLVSEGARIVAFDRDVRAYVGGTVTMRCDSSGFDGRISWSREEGPLPDSAVADDISLTLSDVDESAAGRYVCWVLDQYGRRQEDVITLQIEPPGPEPLAVACAPGMFPCMSGECLAIGDFCDGQPDCADGSDESGCSPQYGQGRNAALSLPPEETPLESTASDAVADDTATDGAVADDTAADDTAADDDAAYDTAANDAVADDTAADDTAGRRRRGLRHRGRRRRGRRYCGRRHRGRRRRGLRHRDRRRRGLRHRGRRRRGRRHRG
ncbi:basement membrane-specific heparan sulfate proteoglycan core protein-like [Pollicipes pollicipes]|uniref:basement membrane-specific heparan sulfate proteoglycan core protein-like n=1 Tax=Pollicipes pollicipes TaxID=41117 RepID=UPI0018850C2E|nr:basement membrane-specific heparan sulfate proteoglycan core protein-like [Pollicipes pollicipes]